MYQDFSTSQMVYGIDLGTTNIACVGKNVETGRITKFTDQQGQPLSSQIAINRITGDVECGYEAKKRVQSDEWESLPNILEILENDKIWSIAGKQWKSEDLLILAINALKKQLETSQNSINIENCVVTKASSFSPSAFKKFQEVAKSCGLKIDHVVHEHIAALYYYLPRIGNGKKVVVFDWGGKCLKISILTNGNNSVKELYSDMLEIGGYNIDYKLAQFVHNELIKAGSEAKEFDLVDQRSRNTLIMRCEEAKKTLSRRPRADLSMTHYGNTIGVRRHIYDTDLNRLIVKDVEQVLGFLDETIRNSGIVKSEIDYILTIGGSSRLPSLQQYLKEQWETKLIAADRDAEWSASLGAAMLAEENGIYSVAEPLYVLLSDDTLFPIVETNTKIEDIEYVYNFAIVEDAQEATFIFCDKSQKRLGYLSVPVYGFFKEKIVLDVWSEDELAVNIRACSERRSLKDAKKLQISALKLSYKFPEYSDR